MWRASGVLSSALPSLCLEAKKKLRVEKMSRAQGFRVQGLGFRV